jgi:hypothetical protein
VKNYARLAVPRTRLLEILYQHRGEANAITANDLAVVLRIRERDNRSLREAIGELILDGHPIGSTSRENASGYYVIATEKELRRATATLRGRIEQLQQRIDALERAFELGPRQPLLIPDGRHG